MKNLRIILTVLFVASCTGEGIKSEGFDEIDIFKIDNLEIESYLLYIQHVKTDLGKLGLRGNVKSMEYSESDWEYSFFLDKEGRFNETRRNHIGYDPYIQRFVYDSKNGRLLRIDGEEVAIMYKDNKETKEKRTFSTPIEYDEKGRLKDAEYDQTGVLLRYYALSYDSNGNIVALNEDVSYGKHFHYDSNGACIKLTYSEESHDDDTVNFEREFTYNSNRDIETDKWTVTTIPPQYAKNEKPKTVRYSIKYSYEYDRNGNWTKRTAISDQSKTPVIQTRKIEYY